MANLVINGATYEDVPSIEVPNEQGEMVEFKERMTQYEACIADFKARGWTEYEGKATSSVQIRELLKEKQYVTKLAESVTLSNFSDLTNLVLDEFPTTTTTTLSSGLFNSDANIYCADFFGNVKEINTNAFGNCSNLALESLNSILTYIGASAFIQCFNLRISEVPSTVNTLGSQAFQKCHSIESIKVYSGVKVLNQQTFYSCQGLQKADISPSSIASLCFAYCQQLSQLIIRSESVPTLASTNSLSYTPIASGTGYIYVPSALVDSYKSATNWSVYANQFRALEDYTVDGTITGELDESKI